MKRLCVASIFVGLVATTSLWADLVIHQTMTQNGAPISVTLYVGGDRLAMTQSDGQGMIYDARKQTVFEYSRKKGTYTEMTAASMKAIQTKSQEILARERAQIEEQMKSLPKDQQAAMKQALAQMDQKSKHSYRLAGPKVTVGKWSALPVDELVDGEQNQKLWVVPISALGITTDDLKVLNSFGKFLGEMGDSGFGDTALDQAVGFKAFAVKTSYQDMSDTVVTVVQSVGRQAAPAGAYTLPSGLTKTSVPGM